MSRSPTPGRQVALAVLALLLLSACGGATPGVGHRSPTPASAPRTTLPSPSSTPTPEPSTSTLIPQRAQQLTLTGAVTGTVSSAEIKDCGVGAGRWGMTLSDMTVTGGSASLSLLVSAYTGAGSYQPTGALNAIISQELGTYSVQSGTVTTASSGSSGSMNLALAAVGGSASVQIRGDWACG